MPNSVNYTDARHKLVSWVKEQLTGEKLKDDILIEPNPYDRYFIGILYPQSQNEQLETAEEDDIDSNDMGAAADESATNKQKIRYKPPSSIGFSFYLNAGNHSIRILFSACKYKESLKEDRENLPNAKAYNNQLTHWKKTQLKVDESEITAVVSPETSEKFGVLEYIGKPLAELSVTGRPHKDGQIITVTLINKQSLSEVSNKENESDRLTMAKLSLFEVELKCIVSQNAILDYPTVNRALLSDEEKEIELRYKDERVFAIGHGTAARWTRTFEGDLEISSDFMPMVEIPQVTADTGDKSSIVLSFEFLAGIVSNNSVIEYLTDFVNKYEHWIAGQNKAAETEPDEDKATANRILKKMQNAKKRMMDGISLLERDSDAKTAFAIANQAMLAQMQGTLQDSLQEAPTSASTTPRWRPFQIAFVLMLLEPSVNEDSDFRDIVDLIWFPTGGGKTEAYLGLMAFVFIYRRLRFPASAGGTVTIMRYTLRLLTAQQFTRACKVISALELIRQSNSAQLGSEPFTVGLWLGKATSPNTYKQAIDAAQDNQFIRFVLSTCPWCNHPFTSKNYVALEDHFYYTCTNLDCDFGKNPDNRLPYNVIDEALYENPPSLLISTVDKFAMLAWIEKSSAFFGKNSNRPPELIIQDELHLISGALGSIVGLYEVGFETAIIARGVRAKYIASTATIKNAKEQIKALFARDMAVFPPAGLRHTDSYFAKTVPIEQKPGRLYVGYLAYGMSRTYCMEPLSGTLLAAPARLFNDDELLKDAWWTQIAYHGSLKGVSNSRTNYQSGVVSRYHKLNELNCRDELEEASLGSTVNLKQIDTKYPDVIKNDILRQIHDIYYPTRDLNIKSLTSNQTAAENAETFDALRFTFEESKSIDAAIATNLISVGLDVERLGLMIINGQPLTTAEYIQASSRVGRGKVPGIVFINYYKTQARSLSHYENFLSYHQTFYRYVEPTSLTPFTFQVRKRALHAALIIALRHSNIGLLENQQVEAFNPDSPTVKNIIKQLKIRIKQAAPDQDAIIKSHDHLDCLINEWSLEIERCNEEQRNLRYNPSDKSAEALMISFDAKTQRGLWPTLHSMRNVDKTGLFRILRGLKHEER